MSSSPKVSASICPSLKLIAQIMSVNVPVTRGSTCRVVHTAQEVMGATMRQVGLGMASVRPNRSVGWRQSQWRQGWDDWHSG